MSSNTRRPRPLRTGSRVHVHSEHFEEECDAEIAAASFEDGWLYRIHVLSGDRLDAHRSKNGELWVCDFEVWPLPKFPDSIRSEVFQVIDGDLMRLVNPQRGPPYAEPCSKFAYKQICRSIEELAPAGFTRHALVRHAGVQTTSATVALSFLRDRYIVNTRYRTHYVATPIAESRALAAYLSLVESTR